LGRKSIDFQLGSHLLVTQVLTLWRVRGSSKWWLGSSSSFVLASSIYLEVLHHNLVIIISFAKYLTLKLMLNFSKINSNDSFTKESDLGSSQLT
jgi:hypothetical protein